MSLTGVRACPGSLRPTPSVVAIYAHALCVISAVSVWAINNLPLVKLLVGAWDARHWVNVLLGSFISLTFSLYSRHSSCRLPCWYLISCMLRGGISRILSFLVIYDPLRNLRLTLSGSELLILLQVAVQQLILTCLTYNLFKAAAQQLLVQQYLSFMELLKDFLLFGTMSFTLVVYHANPAINNPRAAFMLLWLKSFLVWELTVANKTL